ncbi:phosphonate ABC transporter, permease protein PhnE [Psychromonas sp. 14N.309.X.WAT.B.A12]|uniref:phosphonate ABC transporter, permease protein PhnE n=1 Tax=Psychromonas sp. 14N.309.X.WAT.B.A12 TaxID=2998322 RepID=UPI0025B22E8B|nr:phosphonate ABC transporter, permease protein PhnE [Psychromonas sp. 14N.309.X.WAT.B.A12]MDN2664942.1 phosphonate ABC transporter, permease protein PhnE [Psychromonas sp. 14N.309.X.WAT.B.A12]
MDQLTQHSLWKTNIRHKNWMVWGSCFVLALLTAYCWTIMTEETIWEFVYDAPVQGADLINRMFPPDWLYINKLYKALWDTINIATLGTLLGLIIALPVAFLAARNTTPSVLFVRPIALFVIAASRSINSLIWALLLVMILGPGILAGVLAIGLRSVGFIAKLFYESIEEINTTSVEAIESTGASHFQVINYAIIPQVLPAFLGVIIFRWDINIRESTILGLVGAGGIGLFLSSSLNVLAWPQVTLIIVVILATVIISEFISAKVRSLLIG